MLFRSVTTAEAGAGRVQLTTRAGDRLEAGALLVATALALPSLSSGSGLASQMRSEAASPTRCIHRPSSSSSKNAPGAPPTAGAGVLRNNVLRGGICGFERISLVELDAAADPRIFEHNLLDADALYLDEHSTLLMSAAEVDALGARQGVGTPGGVSLVADVARRFGVNAEANGSTDPADVRAALERGHGVIVNGQLGHSSGHFLYLSGLDENGDYIVCDPWRPGIQRWNDGDLWDFTNGGPNPPGFAEVWPA